MVKQYDYYRQILERMKNKRKLPVYRINQIGGRMSSKTWSGIDFIIMASLIAKVKTDAFRWTKGKDRKELYDQIIEVIQVDFPGLKDRCVFHNTNKTITFPNGSVIEVSGLRERGSSEVQLTGKSGSNTFDYQIALAEERYEIPDESWAAVLQALRGTNKFLEMHLANPWVFSNDYVKYCNDIFPFSIDELKNKGQQFIVKKREEKLDDGTVIKYKEIFHYTNYQINNYLEDMQKMKLQVSAKHDPHRKDTILYGYPGSPKGGIWKWVLPKMKQVPREPNVTYYGGVDYGERADATTAYVIGFNAGNSHAHVMHEYYHKNKSLGLNKDTSDLAEDVVLHYLNFMEEIGMNVQLQVKVDGAAIPFITALNTYADSIGASGYVSFSQQTNKKRVADRIETMKTMASFGLITVDEECTELLRELNEQVYSDKSRTSIDYVDGDDHGTDAMYYGIQPKWVELLENMELERTNEAQEMLNGGNND